MPCPRNAGFTLIELSIVLVIIGLLVGGILVGRDLIHAAEMRSVTTDIERFKTAINAFNLKYNCLPGDCANAETLFGTDSSGCPSGGGDTGTCNGDGNGRLEDVSTSSTEWFRAWQQLADADLIEGKYNGVASPARAAVPGVNVPASSKINGAGYSFYRESGITSAHSDRFIGSNDKEVIEFGAQSSAYETVLPIIAPLDAFNIDSKMDDGLPGTGSVMSYKAGAPGVSVPYCSTTTSPDTARYYLSRTTLDCSLMFLKVWP